ncbi:MAG: hypothetical protein JKY93_08195 [Gammaproteobacteria bacterium]|nr:hypothetical protein [Gammaproteobacteria bacterium]
MKRHQLTESQILSMLKKDASGMIPCLQLRYICGGFFLLDTALLFADKDITAKKYLVL